jgi:hypothetical protein
MIASKIFPKILACSLFLIINWYRWYDPYDEIPSWVYDFIHLGCFFLFSYLACFELYKRYYPVGFIYSLLALLYNPIFDLHIDIKYKAYKEINFEAWDNIHLITVSICIALIVYDIIIYFYLKRKEQNA